VSAAPSPSPTPSKPSAPSPIDESFGDLEGFTSAPSGERIKADKKTPETPPEDKIQDEEKPVTPLVEKKPDETPPGDRKLPTRTAELRTAYEKTKLERDEYRARNEALQEKLKTFEGQNVDELKSTLEAREKRLKELENTIRFAKFEESDEFKERFQQPFLNAYQTGRGKTKSLKVIGAEGERQGTEADFDSIVRIPDDDQAAELAAEMFGAKASIVLYHRERVYEANEAMNRASEEFKKHGSEREKQTTEAMKKSGEQRLSLWNKLNADAAEKFPQYFKPVDGDEKGNELLQKGYEIADLAFSGGVDKDGRPIPPEKMVAIHASVRNRAAAFGRLVHQNKTLTDKIVALEADLAKFKESEPGGGEGGETSKPSQQTPGSGAWESDLEKRAIPA
jgi:hypothetical protein